MIPRWPAPRTRRTPRSRTPRTGRVVALTVAALAAALLPPLAARAATPPAPPSDARLAARPARHDDTREQFYFVMPDRFANGDTSNDRGGLTGSRTATGYDPTDKGFYQGGDLKGLTKRLDYIKGLGTTAIWMAPIFKNQPVQGTGADASAGYHGYWITDFTQVDPHFGTNKDLADLISKAHAKGMKVFFDVITNHTADVVDYEGTSHDYLSKGAFPYLTKDGRPFDDADFADGTKGFPAVSTASFPRTPTVPAEKKNIKVPSWLNDPTMYHNRGDSTYAGENATYGDFSGLDDLWTERPEVVSGMEKIYERWVRDFGVDGFRIDTVKHVDMEFWTQWATALDKYAAAHGRKNFFMFGEVYSADTSVTSPYVTQGRLDATLDFPFQDAARTYASQGGSAQKLASVFGDDYKYTTDKANAYEQVTFLGNHDMGRIGYFLTQDNPKASDAELLKKDELANELMFLSRGNPVVYYGDEQGFTGSGGDKDARQTMFASKVADYLDDDEIGTDRTHADDSYDTSAPLYEQIRTLAELRRENPALTDGVQTERYAADGAGIYAFSRTSTGKDRTEYVVALNNAGEAQEATFATGSADMRFKGIYGTDATVTSGADKKVTVSVPARSAVVLRAAGPLEQPAARPTITLGAPAAGATGTVDLTADVGGGQLDRVVFAAQVGNGVWRTLGSADHAPYKVTQTIARDVPAGTAVRYKAVVIDSAGRTASATAQSTTGTPPAPQVPTASSRDYAIVHYKRADGDYGDWGLYAWGDLADGEATNWPDSHPFVGRDAYGAFAYVKLKPGASNVGFLVIDKNGNKDVSADRSIDVTKTGEVWVEQGKEAVLTERPAADYPPQDKTKAVIHYHRADGDYDGWGLHVWTGAANPTDWSSPLKPVRTDAYGAVFEVPLTDGATSLSYIIHKGDEKDLAADQSLDLSADGHEVWLLGGQEKHLLPQPAGSAAALDLTTSKAIWIDRDTVAWNGAEGAASTQLVYSHDGSIAVRNGTLTSDDERWLRLTKTTLTDAQKAKFPHLKDYTAWSVDPRDRDRVRAALSGQIVASQRAANGAVQAATGVQIAGVLDDVYDATKADLGPTFHQGRPTLAVWAPTAQSVELELDGSTVAMKRDATTGVWSVTGPASWKNKPYRYVVKVWAPSVRKIVTNKVTDPYSLALTADSERSLVVDLNDRSLAPSGWSDLKKPKAVPLRDAQIQELHIRDFSVADKTVPAGDRGSYLAFTDKNSDGPRHLRELARSGTSYVHLLPAFDIATIPEKKSEQASPDCDLASYAADSDRQQACVTATAAKDAYNWGYDPYHFTVPEGSYATDPDGTGRTVEFRKMVRSLNQDGLRVVMDVVYNHTAAAGEADTSVLDRIVPGYYQRLLADGSVATSTCCAGTAPENAMMGKLVVDSIVTWAKEYKVDGFRFDLMGHHPKANILAVRKALDALTPAKDGVDGKKIILYGEGWNFGEVANDARFAQATQKNMAGTGIATFSDRARDAVRGGSPFDSDPGIQGFASGLYTDPNSSTGNGTEAEQKARLLHYQDLIKVGLTGDLAEYRFTDDEGKEVTGAEVDYNGAPAGYADAPGDALAYVDAHDNESLFDALTYKLPKDTSAADRARMQVLAMATATLSQGPSLSQAGSDLLRSKSLDRNSFDSGDWFNAIHWDCRDGNGFGRGLPPAADNGSKWTYAKSLLASVEVGCGQIDGTSAAYRDLLKIRSTEPVFSLATADQVQSKLSFPLSGKDETPGVITMRLGDLVVVLNATPRKQTQTVPDLADTHYALHPVQAAGADPIVKTSSYAAESGTFAVPGRTVAVFARVTR